MKHTPITAKQAKAQLISGIPQCLLGILWIIMGMDDHKPVIWALGIVYLLFQGALAGYAFWLRKHYPLEDSKVDQILEENMKASRTGGLVVMAVITVGFLIAFGLAWALS